MTTLFQMTTKRLAVETASATLKRLYWIERELYRATAARHMATANWDAKIMLPRHLWEDSLHADSLRTRVLELRYPRRDVDQEPPTMLVAVLHELVKSRNDAELLAGIYAVFKPALVEAYDAYLSGTDAVDDAPTIHVMRRIREEKRAQIAEGRALLAGLPSQAETATWTDHLTACLRAVGGLHGGAAPDPDLAAGSVRFSARPGYQRPLTTARDPRFLPAVFSGPPWKTVTPLEKQVSLAINHANEMWAAEVPLMLAWELDKMPWEFYRDVGRWAWDECRHSMMGVRRLQAWGFEVGIDTPMVAEHYHAIATEPPIAILAALHGYEMDSPAWKKGLKESFEAMDDTVSAQDCDYDWADEAIHLSFGRRWLTTLVDDEDEIEALAECGVGQWQSWLATVVNQPGAYEPFGSRIKARLVAMTGAG